MSMQRALAAICAGSLILAACAGGSGPARTIPDRLIERALRGAPGEAQPSTIVKAELAFNRRAREQGQWSAFRAFAASGAVLHSPSGAVKAGAFLADRPDPAVAAQWEVRAVWMSCDGSSAVSQGRLRNAEGKLGTYVTVWERQSNSAYRYVYSAAGLDDPQPPPRAEPHPEPGGIVVEAMDAVQADIADCPKPEDTADIRPASAKEVGVKGAAASGFSRDASLMWSGDHGPNGKRVIDVHLFKEGELRQVFTQDLPSPAK